MSSLLLNKAGLNNNASKHELRDSLIISDIKMPEMNGMEFLKNVRAVNPNIMVIMMTAFPEIDSVVEALRLEFYPQTFRFGSGSLKCQKSIRR